MAEKKETKEIVRIYSLTKKYQIKPLFISTPYSPSLGRHINGLENHKFSDKEIEAVKDLLPKKEELYPVVHNKTLTLTKENGKYVLDKDYIFYCLCNVQPNIAKSMKDANVVQHTMYMTNIESEAKQEVENYKLVGKAQAKLAETTSLEDLASMMYYVGENPVNKSTYVMEKALYEKAQSEPNRILEYFNDIEESKTLIFIRKAIANGVIKKGPGGYLMYDKVNLGKTDKDAAIFVFADSQDSLYKSIDSDLSKKSN